MRRCSDDRDRPHPRRRGLSIDAISRRGAWLRARLDGALFWSLVRGWLLAVAVAVVIARLGDTYAWGYAHSWLPHPGMRGNGAAIVLLVIVALSYSLGRGDRVYNSFPVRYFDPGTMHVAHPTAGPRVRVPTVLTPPLGSQAP